MCIGIGRQVIKKIKLQKMLLEKQVCTLEQAKKLKEMGMSIKSLFWWKCNPSQDVVICGCHKEMNEKYFSFNKWFSAYTVAELGEMLEGYESRVERQNTGRYLTLERGLKDAFFYATDTEAEARANLLIFLIEKGYITKLK